MRNQIKSLWLHSWTTASFVIVLFWVFSVFSFLYRRLNLCSVGLRSGDWPGHSEIFQFCPLMKSFVVLAVCCGSLSCCIIIRPHAVLCTLAARMFWIHSAAFIMRYLMNQDSWTWTALPSPCLTDELVFSLQKLWGSSMYFFAKFNLTSWFLLLMSVWHLAV